jgi:hypothetical protein
VTNKGGVRGEGVAGWLLTMAQETGSARRTAALGQLDRGREMRARPTRQRGRRGEGRVGWPKAIGPAGRWANGGKRGSGPRLGQKLEMGQSSKRNSFQISIDFFLNLAEL